MKLTTIDTRIYSLTVAVHRGHSKHAFKTCIARILISAECILVYDRQKVGLPQNMHFVVS